MRPLIPTILLGALAVIILFLWGTVLNPPKKEIRDQRSEIRQTITEPSVTFIDPTRGDRGARVKIIEYGDFLCTACAQVEETLKTVLAAHPEIALVWKSVPDARIHIEADLIAEAAHCAGTEGKFWNMHEALFKNQEGLTQETAIALGASLGLGATFRGCVEARETRVQIERSVEEAIALGIDGTPYFFVGNERLSGAPTVQEFETAIRRSAVAEGFSPPPPVEP